jgi:hypothetical protein
MELGFAKTQYKQGFRQPPCGCRLQRSTVSLIIEQLIRERWVISGPLGRLPRGRRPTFLQLNDRRAIVVVTVSEGIGVGIVSNGQLIRGLNGMAGEFGHVPLDLNGPQCGCGACGCWTRDSSAGTSCSVRYWASNCTRFLFAKLLQRTAAPWDSF